MRLSQLLALFFTASLLGSGCIIIEDGEVGVSKRFGAIADEPVGQGIAFTLPIVRSIETWNIKLQEIKEKANVPSSEGLIVGLDTSFLFQVMPNSAPQIRKTVGRDYDRVLIIPYFRNAVRDVVSGYQIKNIYSETGRKEIASRIADYLTEKLEPQGIKIVDVLLRDVVLPERFKESIERKLTAEQKAEQKTFELAQARKDAEIEIARAEGAAQAQKIIRSTLSDGYLQYLWIQSLKDNPATIYVATEANLPMFKSVISGK